MAERDETFLARWSRRKQAARKAEPEQEPRRPPQGDSRAADVGAAERTDRAVGGPALPDPATLDASSDFSVFLGRDVPVETHRAALRRLWRLDPFYNRHDGLSDYCEDFTDQAKVVKGLRTAYRVGRGLLGQAREAAALPHDAPALKRPGDEPQRIAAPCETSDPKPEDSEPGPPPAAESKPPSPNPRGPDPRRPRALPRHR